MRLNKFLSDAGVCSRRQADRYVEQGRILVDGEPAQMGQKVHAGQDIRVDGKRVSVSRKQIVLAVNKPKALSVRQRSERKIISLILLATLRGFIRWDDWIKIPRSYFDDQ